MELFIDILKILLPALIVLYAVYLIVKSFLDKELEKKMVDLKTKNTELVLPIRLQAYERMCLFLERITPHNLVVRLNKDGYSAREFHKKILEEINHEYNHNLSQQVYMSDQSWLLVKNAKEQIISIINQSADQLQQGAKGMDLAKMIFDNLIKKNEDPTSKALTFLKDEIRQIF
ncbi:MAG: hypothetical protein FVQ77_02555 [Cytophagales bacterium]|nr:hypothetical protein [Cytophagales bacterium]